MALTATIYSIEVELSDVDRGVYETLNLKLAQHPSESPEYLVTRLLAYCLEYTEGIEFTQGVSSGDEPAILIKDLTGRITGWIEVGMPSAERLHRASKTAERVAVYTNRELRNLLSTLEGARIHRREEIAVVPVDKKLISAIAERVDRRTSMSISITEQHMYIDIGGTQLTSVLAPTTL